MALRLWARYATAAAFVLAFANPIDLESCGPFIPSAVFVRPGQPEDPAAFFKGQVGVLQPTYWRRYLAMAYRILSGLPLSPAQVGALSDDTPALPVPNPLVPASWQSAREKVSAPASAVTVTRMADFNTYQNCNDDAFYTAIATLEDRIREAGVNSEEVHDWAASQDVVFWNCGSQEPKIPSPAPPGSSARIRSDRAYQVAAAHFYAGHFDEARSLFQAIARDPDSPWRTIAPYVAARADLRKGDLIAAKAALEYILGDPGLAAIHAKAEALLGLVVGRIDPFRGLLICSKRLVGKDSTTLEKDLADFTFLYDKARVTNNGDDLISWIEVMQGRRKVDQAIERWQRDHSLPWLVAALTLASKSTPQAADLVTAGLAVPPNSPAWATARYHAVRLLIDLDRIADARKALDEVTPLMASLSRSSKNAYLSEKMETAGTLDKFLAGAVRLPVGTISDVEVEPLTADQQSHPLLGDDAASAFNFRLPLAAWLQAIKAPRLTADLRKHVAQTGFVRAFLLKDALAGEFAQIVAQRSPADAASMRGFIAATGADDKFYEGLFWLLHRPGIGPQVRGGLLRSEADPAIDSYRDNWWSTNKIAPAPFISFENAGQKKLAADEATRLADMRSARFCLATQVLAWAQSRPDDPRLPEALAMTIRMSHYSAQDSTADPLVERAFNILHQRFPASTWAKQTPYWFK